MVVTVPMTAATTAISVTAETTSRVRSVHGPRHLRGCLLTGPDEVPRPAPGVDHR